LITVLFKWHYFSTIIGTCNGTNTFKNKQSSLPTILFFKKEYCMLIFPTENAFNVPDHPGCLTGDYNIKTQVNT